MCVRVRACDRNQNVIYPSARCLLTLLHGMENKIRHRQTGQTQVVRLFLLSQVADVYILFHRFFSRCRFPS